MDHVPKDAMITERQFDLVIEQMLEQVFLSDGDYVQATIYELSLCIALTVQPS